LLEKLGLKSQTEVKNTLALLFNGNETVLTLQAESRNRAGIMNEISSENNLLETLSRMKAMKAMSDELRIRLALPAIALARQNLPHPSVVHTRSAPTLAGRIDHTFLKPDATRGDIQRICLEARTHQFATVCVNSSWIPLASELLEGGPTVPIAVVGFPLGASSSAAKAFETRQAISDGAREIDMVIAVGRLKGQEYEEVLRDIAAVIEAAHPYPVKVILETSLLSHEEKIAACCLAQAAGAAFVKTSTGFSTGGATIEDIRLMRQTVGSEIGVKASGGIRTREDAERMIAAGADRIGASASVAIVKPEASSAGTRADTY
jgi:deoxyribose-phosphate aldolase